jgi:vacuolar-type H+-ATPase subunit H
MPAVSKAQQRFMGMVHAVKKGEMAAPSPEVAQAAASMKKKDAKDFASTKHKGLPEKKEVKKKGKKKFSDFSKDMEAAKKRTYEVDKKTPYNVHKNTRYY